MTYSISEVETLTGLNASTLRYYEKEGLLPSVSRSSNGRRIYSDEQMDWLKFVIALKSTGMTLDEIKSYVDMIFEGDDTLIERREFLEQHKKRIEQQMTETFSHMQRIIQKITYYDTVMLKKDYLDQR
ncbi:MerR family transcriptional regulator [Saccharibacillus sp. JS10]|uniref:MerR family transcriptional regulator n=1 Tax=Saccharibacillus sp. JS10 TaxID=2950552 RepID=UPI00210CD789|nr:MerR family transcriptional regulator [Saccharibacillus sp. JS10]MCQ4087699.1 MerR family transcriptional regulator [Saccharibacillus sp. JS10]